MLALNSKSTALAVVEVALQTLRELLEFQVRKTGIFPNVMNGLILHLSSENMVSLSAMNSEFKMRLNCPFEQQFPNFGRMIVDPESFSP